MQQPVPVDRNRRYTVEEYFRICEASDIKYEYRDGELIPHGGWERDENGNIIGMAGGTLEHSVIACNLIREIGNGLKGTPCLVANSDMRVHVARSGRYVLPDVTVYCGSPQFSDPDKRLTLSNPQVVIEVLSPSTANDDHGEKFRDYIAIDSLQEYILVSQDRASIQTFYRQTDGVWAVGPWSEGLDASLKFRSLDVTIPMAEIYAGITFPPAKPMPEGMPV